MTTIPQRLTALRERMQQAGISACIVPGTDPHNSEYMASHWAEMQWISGFQGETGTAVITLTEALLWTDSRYYLQAEKELQGTTVRLMRESDIDCPTIAQWLQKNVQGTVAVNAEMYTVNAFQQLKESIGSLPLTTCDLIRPIWTDNRPDIPMNPLYIYDDIYVGESVEDKLMRVRQVLKDENAQALLIAALDEVGWLLNIRGTDVDYTPCVIGYVIVENDRCTLFADARKVSGQDAATLQRKGVSLLPYEAIYDYLRHLSADTVLMDGNRVNEALYEAVTGSTVRLITPCPVQRMMSVKNETEIQGERLAMIEDGVALTRFFRWLDRWQEERDSEETELTLAARLHDYRAQGRHFTDDSFCTIAGWNANGAIVHYHAEEGKCATIKGSGVLLLDSGGQYLDGTTDITRTIWIGDEKQISDVLRHDYTLVMKGHIALARARFPKGTRGNQLDVLAHQYMWQEGITYGHGTGHGVGHFMGCHEGPANIRTDNNTNPIRLGNIFSDEPGIYRTGEYGIRTENLILTVKAGSQNIISPVYHPLSDRTTGEEYYEFETLTLCFYDTRLLNLTMLTADEKAWLNAYHRCVFDTLSPHLDKEDRDFLKEKCQEL
ncbi:MAG: aminopeptidase P family N-terminal domain-containing protein [Paludibacteraceae bacterium]|nr:aminopeptidase P family N-terminal domain-containing protein [Paludibacteraceae bacterium]